MVAEGEAAAGSRRAPKASAATMRRRAHGRGQQNRRRRHPESRTPLSPEAREAVFQRRLRRTRSKGEEVLVPAAKIDEMDRARPVGVVLEAKVDDQAGAERHRDDEKDHAAPARRPGKRDAAARQEIKRAIKREHDERRDAENVAPEPLLAPSWPGKAAAVIEAHERATRSSPGQTAKTNSVSAISARKRHDPERIVSSHHLIDLARLPPFDAAG